MLHHHWFTACPFDFAQTQTNQHQRRCFGMRTNSQRSKFTPPNKQPHRIQLRRETRSRNIFAMFRVLVVMASCFRATTSPLHAASPSTPESSQNAVPSHRKCMQQPYYHQPTTNKQQPATWERQRASSPTGNHLDRKQHATNENAEPSCVVDNNREIFVLHAGSRELAL